MFEASYGLVKRTKYFLFQGFDEESGEPRVPIIMKSWPSHQFLKKQGMQKDYLGRCGISQPPRVSMHAWKCNDSGSEV